MNGTRDSRSCEGAVLPTIILITFVVSSAVGMALTLSLFEYRLAERSIKWEQALAAAESGVELGVARIAYAEYSGGSLQTGDSGTVGDSDHLWAYTIGTDASGQYVEGTGTIDGLARTTKIYGVARGYWSKFAYFANYYRLPNADGTPGSRIWFITGDDITGPVHCNEDINISGRPSFDGPVTYVGEIMTSTWNGTPDPEYLQGAPQRVGRIEMGSINFAQLKDNAEDWDGIIFTGDTKITMKVDPVTSNTIMTAVYYDTARFGGTGLLLTNDFVIGGSSQNMVYVENGDVPDPGAGEWQTVEILTTNMVWVFSDPITTTNSSGYWSYSTQSGAGWINTWCEKRNRTYRWRTGPQYARVGNSTWRNPYDWQYQSTTISNVDETVEVTTNMYAQRKSVASHNYADDCTVMTKIWIGPTTIGEWHGAGEVATNGFATSNEVLVVTNESVQIWVQDTNATLTMVGNLSLEGVISRGITIVADRDIRMTDDFVYTNEYGTGYAYTNPASDVMAAIISGGDIIVQDNGVGDFTIHASIMAIGSQTGAAEGDPNNIDGRFYVENYWSGSMRGELTVYGGIIQNWRGAVGTGGGGGTGFLKDYFYDSRFGEQYAKAPPGCPMLGVSFSFSKWAEW